MKKEINFILKEKYNEAIECFNETIKLNPNNESYWNNKGLSLNSLGKYNEAIECCNEATKLNPKYATYWNNKGDSLNSLGKYNKTIYIKNNLCQSSKCKRLES